MKRILFSVVALLFLCASFAFAAPVNVPWQVIGSKSGLLSGNAEADKENSKTGIAAALEYEFLDKRAIEDMDATMTIADVKINFPLDKFELYAMAGSTFETEAEGGGDGLVMDDTIMWGLGISGVIYEPEDSKIKLFGDIVYRMISDADIKSITEGGVVYTVPEDFVPGFSAKLDQTEWHVALGVATTMDKFTPYAGIKYSDMKAKLELSAPAVGTASAEFDAEDNFGIFMGVGIVPVDGIAIDLQGRFIDEQAFSAKVIFKF